MWSKKAAINVSPWRQIALAHTPGCAVNSSYFVERTSRDDARWINAKPVNYIPGPSWWQLIRWYLPGGILYNKNLSDMVLHMEKTYGSVCRLPAIFGRPSMVFTFDPELFQQIFSSQGIWPVRPGIATFRHYRKTVRKDVFKGISGLLSDQGEQWYNLRIKVNPIMMQTRAVKMYVEPVDAVAREFVCKIGLLRDKNDEMPANFGTDLGAWAFESIGVIALDRRLGAMAFKTEAETETLIQAVNKINQLTFELDYQPSMWRYLSTNTYRKLIANYEVMNKIVMEYIDESLAENEKSKESSHQASVLQKLLKIDRHYALVMTFDMLFAGIDTTSNSAINLLYLLAVNPEKQEKLRTEVFDKLPTVDSLMSPECIDHSPFFRGALKESMRMLPIIPVNLRTAVQDIVLNNYQIPKNTTLLMGNAVLYASDKYFANSAEFHPERFMRDANGNYPPTPNDHSSYSFLPFGFGTRMCIGKRFAEMEIQLLVFRILREYRIEWHHEPIEHTSSIIVATSSPLKFRMVPLGE